ncbi:MAG: hypothetical protein ABH816_02685 [Candidatus Levyibacteriota bacterium]
MIRKIIGLGRYSAIVSIPRELMKKLRWRKGQKVEVSAKRKTLQIKDYKN